jgi:hypothetical protein
MGPSLADGVGTLTNGFVQTVSLSDTFQKSSRVPGFVDVSVPAG